MTIVRGKQIALALIALMGIGLLEISTAQAETTSNTISYKDDVQPIVQIRCMECHMPGGPGLIMSGLDMTSYEGLMRGTKYGPMVMPGKANASNLVRMIEGRTQVRMPHNRKRLTDCEIKIIRTWITQGARNN